MSQVISAFASFNTCNNPAKRFYHPRFVDDEIALKRFSKLPIFIPLAYSTSKARSSSYVKELLSTKCYIPDYILTYESQKNLLIF